MTDFPAQIAVHVDLHRVIEEMEQTLAQAQGELFAGRFRDLEQCALKQQELCANLKRGVSGQAMSVSAPSATQLTLTLAERVREHTLVFAAALRRKRRHLEILQRILNGPSPSYVPPIVDVSSRGI